MVRIQLPPLGPRQDALDVDRVREILAWRPRRCRLGGRDWPDVLLPPQRSDGDWALTLPFRETLANAFLFGCNADNIGVRKGKGDRYYTYLCNTSGRDQADLKEVVGWLQVVGRYVAIRDGLCLSFALDFERRDGDPAAPQTEIGALRSKAKPYGRPATQATRESADQLVGHLVEFLTDMRSYKGVDSIVAMPASRSKPFHLPEYLATRIAATLGVENLTQAISTIGERAAMKDIAVDRKVDALLGTIKVEGDSVRKRNVLLVDDLYQSGASVNVAALQLLDAGAAKVYGLYCEKTCRNDDNTRG